MIKVVALALVVAVLIALVALVACKEKNKKPTSADGQSYADAIRFLCRSPETSGSAKQRSRQGKIEACLEWIDDHVTNAEALEFLNNMQKIHPLQRKAYLVEGARLIGEASCPFEELFDVQIQKPDLDDAAQKKLQDLRTYNLEMLSKQGFRVAPTLPTLDKRMLVAGTLRTTKDVLSRLMALKSVIAWVTAEEEKASSTSVQAYIEENGLKEYMSDEEIEIVELNRNDARAHIDTIGWKLEAMLALYWVLGNEVDLIPKAEQITEEQIAALMTSTPKVEGKLSDSLGQYKLRAELEVIEMEDVHYCAHNAVRSAQMGKNSVPEGFHPTGHGGVVQERRQALTWCLSPGVLWDDTDVST